MRAIADNIIPIRTASDRSVLFRYQMEHVRRTRALLETRTAERRGNDAASFASAHAAAGDALTSLEREERIPFAELCRSLRLARWQRDALVVIAAPHLDHGVRAAIAHYWARDSRDYVDAALVLELLRTDGADAFAAAPSLRDDGVLHTAGLIESAPLKLMHASSRLEHELVPTARLLRVFDGEIGLDPKFQTYAQLVATSTGAAVGAIHHDRLAELVKLVTAAHAVEHCAGAAMLLCGASGGGKLRTAMSIAARIGFRHVLTVEASFLPRDAAQLASTVAALAREAEILGAQLVIRRVDNLVTASTLGVIARHCFSTAAVPVWCTSDIDPTKSDSSHLAELSTLSVSIGLPDLALRRDAWRAELTATSLVVSSEEIDLLGSDYALSRSAIAAAARIAQARVDAGATVADALTESAESQMRGQLARFARRSRSKARLDDVVLTDTTRDQVDELVMAVMRRSKVMDRWGLAERHATGRGIVAMFNGPPGTGKTMCAASIANEIDQPLYRIDVSNLVNKFVGETEKNLVRLFEEAAATRAVLLFDEADSLFGKRVEAQDATDRYSNMQVNLLLNLIEDYDGFVVLTTNLKGSLDDAFMRRIVYKIAFEKPGREEMVALWEYHLPSSIPRAEDFDLYELADEFDGIAGGDIKNAVLRAALAADEQPITCEMLRRSLVNELRANGAVVADGW